MKELTLFVGSTHWHDMCRSERERKHYSASPIKVGSIVRLAPTTYASLDEVIKIPESRKEMIQVSNSIYMCYGEIIGGIFIPVWTTVHLVVDCGLPFRLEIKLPSSKIKECRFALGEYISLQLDLHGYFHDHWEGIISLWHKYKVKKIVEANEEDDLYVSAEVLEVGSFKYDDSPILNRPGSQRLDKVSEIVVRAE